MDHPDWAEYALATRAVRVGHARTHEAEHSEPIFATSSFCFSSAREAAESFAGNREGNVYSRFTNPTVRAFQQRLAAMEGGSDCVATSSGMAAILSTCLAVLKAGDHIVSSTGVFGATTMLFNNYLAKFGIETTWVAPNDLDAWRAAVRPETRLFYLETPTNPLTEISDIAAIAEIGHANEALVVVDNCFCTPALQQPLALGADVVIHSATKYLDGQGRCLGGAVVGDAEIVGERVFGFLRTAGPTMSPFNAWVFLKGLETLALRMQAHSQAAMTLAERLADAGAEPPDAPLQRDALRRAVEAGMAFLPEREARVLRHFYGLDGHGARSLGRIGREMGVSRERVRQLKGRALARLREGPRRAELRSFSG